MASFNKLSKNTEEQTAVSLKESAYLKTIRMIVESCQTFAIKEGYEMPTLLKSGMELYTIHMHVLNEHARDILLYSNLGVFSACFPTVRLPYGSNRYSLNFSAVFGAPSSSNKSVMKYALMMLNALNDFTVESYKDELREWEKFNVEWDLEKKNAARDKRQIDFDKQPGEKPKFRCVRVPVNVSKSMLVDLIKANETYGCIMDSTELDSLNDSNSKDYGKLMDIFNKATMNEPIDKAFKVDEVVVSIPYPMLNMIASGTFDQIHKLIVSYETGLGSRIPIYLSPDLEKFISQKPTEGAPDFHKYYEDLGKELLDMWKFFVRFNFTVEFTDAQWDSHTKTWEELFNEVKCSHRELISLSTRFGMLHMRIAAVLTMLRLWDEVKKQPEVYCTMYVMGNNHPIECEDRDFEMAGMIATTLFEHSMMFAMTKAPQYDSTVKEMERWRWQHEVLKMMEDIFSVQDFCAVGMKEPFNKSDKTCYRVLGLMSKGKGKLIKKLKDKKVDGKACYQKVTKAKK